MLTLETIAQDPDAFQNLQVCDLAEILLDYLKRCTPHNAHLSNLCILDGTPITVNTYGKAAKEFNNAINSRPFKDRLAELRGKILPPLAEAWNLLECHGLIAHEPLSVHPFYFTTRKAHGIKDHADFQAAIGQASESAKGKKRASN